MRWQHSIIFLSILLICLAFTIRKPTPIYFKTPKNWPKPKYDFTQNPLTEEGFELGRRLFYDPIVSRDSTISCVSCHLQATGFSHVDHELSHGIEGRIGTRNSMALVNLAWSKDFLWDGGANHLDVQPLNPITSPSEMDETLEHVVAKLQQNPSYPQRFEAAFGTSRITGQLTLKALSQFMLLLQSSNSKYDRMMRGEATFNESEEKGYALFKRNCASCHTEPLFTNGKFENNGLAIDKDLNDTGRMKITGLSEDYMRFKVPSLRNIQHTFPYMHDGRFRTLTEVVRHYNTLQPDAHLSVALTKSMLLSDNDRTDLVAFMKTLTDTEFLFNPKYSFPK